MRLSRTMIEFLFSALIVLFLLWVVWEPRNWPAPAKLFPRSLGLSALALALLQLGVAARAVLSERRTGALAKDSLPRDAADSLDHHLTQRNTVPEPATRRMVTISVWLVVFFVGIWLVGFKIGSFFLTFAFLKFTAKENWSLSAGIALGTYLFFWLVFDIGLKLPLGNGVLADYFALS